MAWEKTIKSDLLLTALVAVMTSYWLVDITLDALFPRYDTFRLFFDFLFFVGQLLVIAIVWNTLKKRRKLQGILVSERQQAENEENRMQAILSAIGEGISIQDRTFRVIYQNDSHKELIGKDCLGEICYQAYSAQQEVCLGCPVDQSFSDGLPHLQEKRLVHSEKERFIEIFSSPMFDRDGQTIAGIEMVRDVTHRVQAERKILQLNEELQQRSEELSAANHELESFNYSLSHDLRSPLAQIETAIDLLAEDIEAHDLLSHENTFFINTIRNGSGRIDQMIQGMLDLARIGRGEIYRTSVDLSAIAHLICVELQQHEPARSVQFTVAPGLLVHADACLSQIVLQNLYENAWKYTQYVAMARIEIGQLQERGRSFIYVRDNGAGFDPTSASRLFMPFQGLHDVQEFPGDGIGLSTVYRIIKRHGGEIQGEGEIGKGAIFTFTFDPAAF